MKNLLYIFALILFQYCIFFQKSYSAYLLPLISIENMHKQTDTLNHDLILVKSLINFNDPNGGYYSEYYMSAFQSIYCGAIVKNIGSINSTNVYLEVNFLDYDNSILSTYYSDTIPTLNSNQIDTLKIQQIISPSYWYYKLSCKIKSDTIDENEVNNYDTIPATTMFDDMWSYVSRANVPSNTLNINQIGNFHSGDFLGITLKVPSGWHEVASIGVYITEPWPDSLIMISKIYQNGILIDSAQIYNQGFSQPYWASTEVYMFFGMDWIIADSTYYIGVELIYPNGTNIPIGIDTSVFHNFEEETIAKISNSWTTLNFVPLIQLICDPEQIQKFEKSNQIQVFPNPNNGVINIINVENSKIEFYDLLGKLLLTDYSYSSNKLIDLSIFSQGNYIVKIINEQGTINKKINIVK